MELAMADLGKALALIFLALTKKKSQCVRQGRPIPHFTVQQIVMEEVVVL
jgi:hypothetical protein